MNCPKCGEEFEDERLDILTEEMLKEHCAIWNNKIIFNTLVEAAQGDDKMQEKQLLINILNDIVIIANFTVDVDNDTMSRTINEVGSYVFNDFKSGEDAHDKIYQILNTNFGNTEGEDSLVIPLISWEVKKEKKRDRNMKRVKTDEENGVWYYKKRINKEHKSPSYELYDENQDLVEVFESYEEMTDYIRKDK